MDSGLARCGAPRNDRATTSKQKAAAMSVRIVDVREITRPISSPIRNAYIDFTRMTTSLVAVVTDAVRDGKKVVGAMAAGHRLRRKIRPLRGNEGSGVVGVSPLPIHRAQARI
jgi:hypothetical protein